MSVLLLVVESLLRKINRGQIPLLETFLSTDSWLWALNSVSAAIPNQPHIPQAPGLLDW